MKLIDLSKKYYLEYGKPMIESKFRAYSDKIAVGFLGNGSEMYGFDDEISKDHDFSVGFMMFLDKETYDLIGFRLLREYLKLPKAFMGVELVQNGRYMNNKYGVYEIEDFYIDKIGTYNKLSLDDFLTIESNYLAEATNGCVFYDKQGLFTEYRNYLLDFPRDVYLQKLGRHLVLAGQSGQYNYNRQIKREDSCSCSLCLNEFINNVISILYLVNNKYELYYKWKLRGLDNIKSLSEVLVLVKDILNNNYSCEKISIKIEVISNLIINYLKKEELSNSSSANLEEHAFRVHNKIKDRKFIMHHILD